MKVINHIRLYHHITLLGISSVFLLLLFTLNLFIPIDLESEKTEAATGTVTASETSLTITSASSVASVDLTVNNSNGTVATSTDASSINFNVTTNNYTGYTLSISANDDNGLLINHNASTSANANVNVNNVNADANTNTNTNTNVNNANANSNGSTGDASTTSSTSAALSSIETATADFSSTNFTNQWGWKPNKYKSGNTIVDNTGTNAVFLPSPTTTATTLNETAAANGTTTHTDTEDNYTIALGARADYTKPAGTYTNTFTLSLVANSITYSISYDNGLPTTSADTVSNMPTVNPQTGTATTTSLALSSNTPTRTGYTFQGWCSTTPTNNSTASPSCSGDTYAAGATFYFNETISNDVTLTAIWKLNSHTVTITNSSNITSSSGGGTYYYGDAVSLSATKASSTTCLTYANPSWVVNSGGNSTITNSTGATKSFIMPDNDVKLTVSSSSSRNTYTIVYNKNNGTGTMSNTTASCGASTTLRANSFTRTGYTFLGWSTSSTATTATYTDKQSISLSRTSTLTLYAVWKQDIVTIASGSSTNMQDVASKANGGCPSTLTTGTAYTLTDSRDGQTYQVARLADGNCWLLDNLRLGAVTLKQTLSTSNTNMSPSKSFSLPSSISSDFNSYTTAQINTASNTKTYSYGSGNGQVGVYYNYCAASAGTICTSSKSSNASYDICPAGWRMPTGGSSGEYQALYTSYDSDVTNFKNALRTPLSGYFRNSSAYGQGSCGYFWSSTFSDTSNMYNLLVYASNVNPTNSYYRYNGFSVRCVLK